MVEITYADENELKEDTEWKLEKLPDEVNMSEEQKVLNANCKKTEFMIADRRNGQVANYEFEMPKLYKFKSLNIQNAVFFFFYPGRKIWQQMAKTYSNSDIHLPKSTQNIRKRGIFTVNKRRFLYVGEC